MQKLESRKLGMEIAGFNPLDTFTPEQVEKMRSMEPEYSKPRQWMNIAVASEFKDEFLEEFERLGFESKAEFIKMMFRLGVKTYEAIQV